MTISPPRPRTVVNRLHCRRQGHDWQQLRTAGGEEHWVCAHCGRVGERVPPRRPAAPAAGSLGDVSLDDLAPEPAQPEEVPVAEPEPDVEAGTGPGPSSATTVAVVAVGVVLVCGLVMLRRRRRVRA